MKGLSFFTRQHCNGTPIRSWTIAAYHHPDSLTWRWLISYSARKSGRAGVYACSGIRAMGFNFHAGINLPILGSLSIRTQPHMWEKQ